MFRWRPSLVVGESFDALRGPAGLTSRAMRRRWPTSSTRRARRAFRRALLTHDNAVSFVDWCSSIFTPSEQDRFSSHAPFHFDLSVLDLYVAIKHGARSISSPRSSARTSRELARFIAAHRLTVWASTPSILTLLEQFGHLSLRTVPRCGSCCSPARCSR
jgi:non-ribosomal peptide synthetase component F